MNTGHQGLRARDLAGLKRLLGGLQHGQLALEEGRLQLLALPRGRRLAPRLLRRGPLPAGRRGRLRLLHLLPQTQRKG